jgi:glycosyltransferase involved in cell wall biosynthesis
LHEFWNDRFLQGLRYPSRPQLQKFPIRPGFFFSRFHKKPFVINTHGSLLGFKKYLHDWKSKLPYRLYDGLSLKTTAKKANKVIVSSRLEYEDALEFGIDAKKLEIIPAGANAAALRQKRVYNDSGPLKLLFVGRIARNRNVEIAIKAVSLSKNTVLYIVGGEERTSSTSKKGYLEELKALAEKLNAQNKIFFTGPKYGEELQRYYLESDVFIYPSSYENLGQPILEAATAGLPIISTPVGIARDIVIPGETGFLAGLESKEIPECIENLRSPGIREAFGKKIRAMVEKNYNWDVIIEKYIRIYKGLT